MKNKFERIITHGTFPKAIFGKYGKNVDRIEKKS
jgi:hypothetical protein